MFILTSIENPTPNQIELLFNTFNIIVSHIERISDTEFIVIPAPRERCAGHLQVFFEKHGAWTYSTPFCFTIDNYCDVSAIP